MEPPMRLFALALCTALFALPALAQVASSTSVPPNPPIAAGVTAQPTATVPVPQTVVTTAPGTPTLEDIGFDPKVKRDPNGKIIKDAAVPTGPVTDANSLRNDNPNTLRSDARPRITPPAAPTVPITKKPVVVPTTGVVVPPVAPGSPVLP